MFFLFSLLTVFTNHFTPADNSVSRKSITADKVIMVIVDESGIISIGRDTVSSDELARYIQTRLFKSYMGTGRMYDKILFAKASDKVPDMVTEVVLQEIKEGQKRALTELCLQKYENRYENISSKQQTKLKKTFPVLFQTKFY